MRWRKTSRTRDLPVVEPKFGTMPAIVWVKAFLRTYSVAESQQMLQEVYARRGGHAQTPHLIHIPTYG